MVPFARNIAVLALPASFVVVSACFDPELRSGLACPDNVCPSGQFCVSGYCEAEPSEEPDEPGDAEDPDGGTPTDDGGDPLNCSEWTPSVDYFDPCDESLTFARRLVLDAGVYRFDTQSRVLSFGAEVIEVDAALITVDGRPVTLLSAHTFVLEAGSSMRVVGTTPLIIAARDSLDIAGDIDGSSTQIELGPGANPTACPSAGTGVSSNGNGSSGGGGGGFGEPGARGGQGGGSDPVAGGVGGASSAQNRLRGGCPGGQGGGIQPGTGGHGGGAIHLASGGAITISGSVHVGGSGGRGARGSSGGGGGGSGGHLGLDGEVVLLAPEAVLAANGGGGGGVDDGGSGGGLGQVGQPSGVAAAGGLGGQRGGQGGARALNPLIGGAVGFLFAGGGGGGGGGVGKIIGFSPVTQTEATVSPALQGPL